MIDRTQPFSEALSIYRQERQLAEWPQFLLAQDLSFDEKLDRWEALTEGMDEIECPLTHRFPAGVYVRQITMPAGSIITSRIHRFESPFFILSGKVLVLSENEGVVTYQGGDTGITKPGTRRLLLVIEETTWATVHPNPDNETNVQALTDSLTYTRPRIQLEVTS